MIDTEKIRVRILSLAFSGALIDSHSKEKRNDTLEDIHRAEKSYDPVTEREYLSDVPKHWNWSRLGYLTNNHGQTVPQKDFCYIDVGTLDNIHHRLPTKENLIAANEAPSRARKLVEYGDVLYSTVRPYLHNICIVDKEFSRTPFASTAFCVMQTNETVLNNKFLFYWLLTAEFDLYSNGDPSKGALYPAIGEKDLLRGPIPIPSIEEQKLIVEKIEIVFSLLDTIDTLQNQYYDNLAVLKSKLIDAGIQGKLTEQLPEDGAAEELYQQIQKSNKVDKKTESIIITNDLPEIPDTWKWVYLGAISTILGGKRIPAGRKLTTENTGHKYIRISDMKNLSVDTDNLLYVPDDIYPTISRYIIRKEDVYITVAGTIGRVGKIPESIDGANLTENADRIVFSLLNQDWLIYCLSSSFVQKQIEYLTTQVAQPKLAIKRIQDFIIPLPPLAEQKRIVARLEEFLPLCERLK